MCITAVFVKGLFKAVLLVFSRSGFIRCHLKEVPGHARDSSSLPPDLLPEGVFQLGQCRVVREMLAEVASEIFCALSGLWFSNAQQIKIDRVHLSPKRHGLSLAIQCLKQVRKIV